MAGKASALDDEADPAPRVPLFARDEVPERQARAKMAVWLGAFTTQDGVRNPEGAAQTYRVADLAADFLAHAKRTFLKHGA